MNFWLVKWPKKAYHAESQNNVIFDVLNFFSQLAEIGHYHLKQLCVEIGKLDFVWPKLSLSRESRGFAIVADPPRIRWSHDKGMWYIVGTYSLGPSRPGNVCSLFFRKFFKTVVFRLYFYAWFSRNRADRLESLEFLERLGRSAPEEWPTSIFS